MGEPFFPPATGREMCELVSEYFREEKGIAATPEQVWNYSPTGELMKVFEWYRQAVLWKRLGEEELRFEARFLAEAGGMDAESPEARAIHDRLHAESEAAMRDLVDRAKAALRGDEAGNILDHGIRE